MDSLTQIPSKVTLKYFCFFSRKEINLYLVLFIRKTRRLGLQKIQKGFLLSCDGRRQAVMEKRKWLCEIEKFNGDDEYSDECIKEEEAALILLDMNTKSLDKKTAMALREQQRKRLENRTRLRLRLNLNPHVKGISKSIPKALLPSMRGHEEILALFMKSSKAPLFPRITSLLGLIKECCSVPYEKQLTKTDLRDDQARISIKKAYVEQYLLNLLNEDENIEEGIPVIVYDENGKTYPMMFKLWSSKIYVLTHGWKTFYIDSKLHYHDDFITSVTLWTFRHLRTARLCFVIFTKTLPAVEPVTRRRIK